MTADSDLDRQIQDYLQAGPVELSDRVLWAARALELPLGTVKSRVFYATRALRAAIEADDRASTAERPA